MIRYINIVIWSRLREERIPSYPTLRRADGEYLIHYTGLPTSKEASRRDSLKILKPFPLRKC